MTEHRRRRPDLRLLLLAVPILALVVLLVLSGNSTPGAPSLPRAADVTTTTVPIDRGAASPLSVPKKVAADVTTVTAPNYGAASIDPVEVAWRNRAATIRAARGERQPWEPDTGAASGAVAARSGTAAALPTSAGSAAAGSGAAAGPATNDVQTTAERAVLTANEGGDILGPFAEFAALVALIGLAGARAFRRRPTSPEVRA